MSLVVPSPSHPHPRTKRSIDENEAPEPYERQHSKRSRTFSGPAARCASYSAEDAPHAISAATLAAIRGLFPTMDEKVVVDVLGQCGDNIDAAIRKLGELRLLEEAAAQQAAQEQAQAAHQQQQQQHAAASQQHPQQQQAGPQPEAASARPGPATAAEWVETLVQEMSSAKDIGDARQRAGAVLQAFEGCVMERAAAAGPGPSSKARTEELVRENQILKRAVQIQNGRIQEAACKEAQLAALQQAVAQYQERVSALERTNYSLTLHLQQFNNTTSLTPTRRPPDVF